MAEHRAVLLLPGLGSNGVIARQKRFVAWLNTRRAANAQIHVFDTKWHTDETYEHKMQRLLDFVSVHRNLDIVYGISAGASLGMGLLPELPQSVEYHFISGKLRFPETIGDERNLRAPALYESVAASQRVIASHDLGNYDITCHAGYFDGVLRQQDMRIPDTTFSRMHMVNHSATIALAYVTILRNL